jgi:hypothetical protein
VPWQDSLADSPQEIVPKSRIFFWLVAALFASLQAFAGTPPAKPVIAGFIDMQDISWHNTDDSQPQFTLDNIEKFPGLFGGIVLNATWNEMQPKQGGVLRTARIDLALSQVRAYNIKHPDAPLGVKLRIFSGNQAPLWAKELGGGPDMIQRNPLGCHTPNPPGCPIAIGRVWSTKYIAAWRAFQMKVARRFDSNPLIRAVAVTSCSMETDEPFVLPQAAPKGYTDTAEEACLAGAVQDYSGWKQTEIDYTFNTFQRLQGGGADLSFSLSVMNACRHTRHMRCELGNHAFASNMRPGNVPIVDAIAKRGPPIHFQTTGPNTAGFNWKATMRLARKDNATAIELWPAFGGFTTLSSAEMKHLHALFEGAP